MVTWKLSFVIFPLPNNDEEIENVSFVKESPEVNAIINKDLANYKKSDGYYLLFPPIQEASEKIKQLILIKAIHNCIFERIEIECTNHELLNEAELKKKEIAYRFSVQNSCAQYYNIYEENDRFEDAINYWKTGFQSKSAGCQEDIIEIAKWVVMAQNGSSEMKSFIMLYLAFNSLYSLFSNYVNKAINSQPKNEIKNLFYNLLSEHRLNEILKLNWQGIQSLSKLNILASDKKKNYSLALEGVINNNCETRHILYCSAVCVHQIRNELFHYGIGMTERRKKIEISKFFLNTVIPRCIRDFISYK